jgi:hypothetical protein
MLLTPQERDMLRVLASQVAEVAALPVQQETIALWKALNGLKPVRPMVAIDQVCWHEVDVDGELALQTESPFARTLETRLRRILYAWRHMRADMVVEPTITIPKVIRSTGLGIEIVEQRAVTDPNNDIVGHFYVDQLKTDEDVLKIHTPELELDEKATAEAEEAAHAVFDGLLAVQMQGMLPTFAVWDVIVQWRGAQNVIYDLADRPAFIHKIMARLTEAYLGMLDQLEEKGLLGYAQSTIHCSGAYTDELPAPGFDPRRPRARDLWTCGMAQIFSTVSPAMHQEFEMDYAVRWYERFGLVYYGCCEPLHKKIDLVKRIPHVRKVSMSPWVDVEQGAQRIGKDLVFSRKPSPAYLAGPTWDAEAVRQDLQDTQECCARHGCPVEFILKDISTVCYQPQRLWAWADVARRVVEG